MAIMAGFHLHLLMEPELIDKLHNFIFFIASRPRPCEQAPPMSVTRD